MNRLCLLALAAALVAGSARADEHFYVIVFGAQRNSYDPASTHTFAIFVRAECNATGAGVLDTVTISWMPRTLKVRPRALLPEDGVNLTLEQTFDWIRCE